MKHVPFSPVIPRNDILMILGMMCLIPFQAFAQAAPAPANNGQPIEITATETVEWLRNEKQYVARKDVIVKQGTMEIHSDLLTADYREGAELSMEIWQLTAEGNVKILDETSTAYGDHGVYDVTKGVAVLTGKDLKLVSPDQTVTARDRMEYHANERLAKAIGNATVVREKDTLKADTLTAYFKDEAAAPAAAKDSAKPANTSSPLGGGGGNIDRLVAEGNVIIITPTEKIYGSKAVYRADTNIADITGKVKLERGENVLEGERAEVNLTTNVSKMFGSEKAGGRVRGLFFPGSENSPSNGGQDKTVAPPSGTPASVGTVVENPPQSGGNKGGDAVSVSPTPPAPAPAKVSPRIAY